MKVYSINTINPNFSFQKKEKNADAKNTDYLLTSSIALATLSIGALAYFYLNNNQYINQLAKGLSKELGQNITSKHLKSIMTKEELLKELSKMNEQNFVASAENIKNGTFLADLHSHSHYSDGTIKIKDFLDQAVEYGNKLNKINGKKFIVALSDMME